MKCNDSKHRRHLLFEFSRLHDAHLMKSVRYFLAYLHDHKDICHDGFTAAQCKTIFGNKILPIEYNMRELYFKYFSLFGNASEIETSNELLALLKHITSNRVHHLQKTTDFSNRFYNNRNF
jgi:hypothetical protein